MIAAFLACAMVTLAGCEWLPTPADPPTVDEKKETSKDKKKDKDTSDWESLDGKKDKKDKKKKQSLISYSYRQNPVSLKDGDDELATGYYVTISLDEDAAKEYPELAARLEEYGTRAGDDLTSYLSGCEEEIREMRAEGMSVGYEEDYYFTPQRSDASVFSYVMECYSYLGGAHGTTSYTAFNIDPSTGKDIKFDDVVKDTSDLPQIIFDDLVAQNHDLTDYFNELPGDKDNLIETVTQRLENNANKLVWSLCYDGITVWFEDYAMGSYVAGTRSVLIKFADHPEVFTGKYDDYSDTNKVPDAKDGVTQEEDADTVMLRIKGPSTSQAPADEEKKRTKVVLSSDKQKALNIFISNFAEQGFIYYDDKMNDMSEFCRFAYLWSRINRPDDVKIDGNYYKVGTDTVKNLVKKYFGRTLSDADLYNYPWKDLDYDYCRDGFYWVPAADGENYTSLAIVDSAEDMGDGTLKLKFSVYSYDIDKFWDNNDTIPQKMYSLNSKQAAEADDLEKQDTGTAVVRKSGSGYTLVMYDRD